MCTASFCRAVISCERTGTATRHSGQQKTCIDIARGTRHEARGTRHEARGTRHEARGTRHEARGTARSSAQALKHTHRRRTRRATSPRPARDTA
ncbi:hypothetical protein E4L70_07225 [Burkholderia pseudomallei]|nr:hypothetical protein [Burkholderia pseudomallei]MPT99587.1 hypothetical protein [Burkholderia pseudomallei]QEW68841.1 hypothetical protein E4F36_17440 [Burkholderia pseudomallei]